MNPGDFVIIDITWSADHNKNIFIDIAMKDKSILSIKVHFGGILDGYVSWGPARTPQEKIDFIIESLKPYLDFLRNCEKDRIGQCCPAGHCAILLKLFR